MVSVSNPVLINLIEMITYKTPSYITIVYIKIRTLIKNIMSKSKK